MNWDTIQGRWTELKGRVKSKWGMLTDDDLDVISGERDELIGRIQQRYGLQREKAEREVKDWLKTV